jgi:hypothetical protein
VSRTFHHGERRIRVRVVRRSRADLRKLGRLVVDLALAQAEAEAQAEHRTAPKSKRSPRKRSAG